MTDSVLLTGVLLVSLTLAGCQAAPRRGAPAPLDEPEVRNLRGDGHVYTSGDVSPAGLERLRARGVRTIIDARLAEQVPPGYADAVRAAGMRYAHLPMRSDRLDPAQADQAIAEISRHDDQPILIQCSSGNRAGALYGAYRGATDVTSVSAALELARQAGLRNPELAGDVQTYLESCRAAPRDAPPAPAND